MLHQQLPCCLSIMMLRCCWCVQVRLWWRSPMWVGVMWPDWRGQKKRWKKLSFCPSIPASVHRSVCGPLLQFILIHATLITRDRPIYRFTDIVFFFFFYTYIIIQSITSSEILFSTFDPSKYTHLKQCSLRRSSSTTRHVTLYKINLFETH